jgi:hypothetical protein
MLHTFECDLKPNVKFQNPRPTPSGKKVTRSERRERENKCRY